MNQETAEVDRLLSHSYYTNYSSINCANNDHSLLSHSSSSAITVTGNGTCKALSHTCDGSDPSSYKRWSRQQWRVLIVQSTLILTSGLAYPLLSTFFPQIASKKGVDSFTIGLIFGIYEFVCFFMAPIFGVLVCIA